MFLAGRPVSTILRNPVKFGSRLRRGVALLWRGRRAPYLVVAALLVFAAANFGWYMTYVQSVPQGLAAIKADGRLVVLTRLAPTTYYLGTDGPTGFEYALTQALGKALGVTVEYRTYETEPALIAALRGRKGQLLAAGLVITEDYSSRFPVVPGYQTVREIMVCRRDIPLPKEPGDLVGLNVMVGDDAAAAEAAAALVAKTPDLLIARTHDPVEKRLQMVAAGQSDCTVATTLELQVNNPYYPELVEAFPLTGDMALGWLAAQGSDDLAQYVKLWIAGMKRSGELAEIARRFFGFLPPFDYVDVRAFRDAVAQTLPDYEKALRDAARKTNLPWQMLAAVAYQESHWNSDARSRTGVRGIMMLTEDTATLLGVDDRLDPIDSIYAGARYIADLRDHLPDTVDESDRLWFALAAYNMGMAHLIDARALADRLGLDKDSWAGLRRALSLIQKPEYAATLKYGPAKGGQALRFVQQVRTYQHMLQASR